MPEETTVLLVDAHHFHASLEEHLGTRSVYVEHATSSDLVQVASVLVPDLVVVSGKSGADSLVDQLSTVRPPVPTLVVADRAQVKKLRELDLSLAALVPHDLPAPAIAHRIATMARRSAAGELVLKSSRGPQSDATSAPISKPPQAKTIAPKQAGARTSPARTSPARTSPARTSPARTGAVPSTAAKTSLAKSGPAKTRMARASTPQAASTGANKPGSSAAHPRPEKAKSAGAFAKTQIGVAGPAQGAERAHRGAPKSQRSLAQGRELESRVSTTPGASLKTTLIGVAAPAHTPRLHWEKTPDNSEPLDKSAARTLASTNLAAASIRPSQFVPLPLDELDPDAITISEVGQPHPTKPTLDPSSSTAVTLAPPTDRAEPATDRAKREASPQTRRSFPRDESSADQSQADEYSVVAQLPIDLRVPLSTARKPSTALRLAYLDTDLTRADLLTGALRRKGLDVFPLTPDVEQTRWPLLRRFAPQALIVDEKGMARASSEWVETFRGDPLLRHVPLIVIRLSRLYHESAESIDLDPLMTLIEHLGKDEAALLEKLAPAREVNLKMSQIGPVRLLQLLTEQDRNTRLDCRGDNERIVWPLGPGYAGKAKLLAKHGEKVLDKLTPLQAMNWLLRHEDLDVAVHEHTEPLAHASESVDSAQLLRDITEAMGIPQRHRSVRPGSRLSHPEASSAEGTAPQVEEIDSGELLPASRTPAHPVSSTAPQEVAIPPAPHAPMLGPNHRIASPKFSFSTTWFNSLAQRCKATYEAYEERIAPLTEKLPVATRSFVAPGLLVTVGLMILVLLFVLGSGSSDDAVASSQKSPPDVATERVAANGPPPTSKSGADPVGTTSDAAVDSSPQPGGDLWKIAPDSNKAGCEEILGDKKPNMQSPANAQSSLRQARKQLLVGNITDAHELMCLSGLYDKDGPAAEALAEYYLGQRSLGQAERWIEISLKADPERRKSRELLADIENQKGNVEKSRRLLLETMKLSGSETSTLAAIGRKLMADARQASRGGDLPRAERALRRAAVLVPESGGIALELSQVLAERKMTRAALAWALHAYSIDPTMSAALFFAGNLSAQLGDEEAARKYFERIVPGDPLYAKATKRASELAK